MLLRKRNFFQGRIQELLIKEGNQCSSNSLSRNYLVSKFAKRNVCINHKIAELLKCVSINQTHLFVKFAVV